MDGSGARDGAAESHTTLTVIATDANLSRFELAQWGRQVHTSMARAIHPFHTARDGDVLFAVTTAAGDRLADNGGLGLDAADTV